MLELASGKKVDLGEIVLRQGGRLRGIVKGPHGKPHWAASIWVAVGAAEAKRMASTNEFGFFAVNGLPAGPIRVYAESHSRAISNEVETKVVLGQQVDVDLVLPPVEREAP
ncbi:MAG: carboxypeptidase-like regulatory domain-containing protein [Myxococcales bacterium]